MDVLLDTHTWIWTLTDDPRLTPQAWAAIHEASAVRVSPITFFEIGQMVRNEAWPEIIPHLDTLPEQLREQGGVSAPLTQEVALAASLMDWDHLDPFDRTLAATAIIQNATLISGDPVFYTLEDTRLRQIW